MSSPNTGNPAGCHRYLGATWFNRRINGKAACSGGLTDRLHLSLLPGDAGAQPGAFRSQRPPRVAAAPLKVRSLIEQVTSEHERRQANREPYGDHLARRVK